MSEEERKIKMIEGLTILNISKQNLLFNPGQQGYENFRDKLKEGTEFFKKHFPEYTEKDFDSLYSNCEHYLSQLTGCPIMHAYTGSRKMWGLLLNRNDEVL